WKRVLPVDGAAGASDVYLDYGDPKIVYASLTAGGGPPAAASTGVFKSVDGGENWAPVGARGLPDGARISAFAVASGTHGRRLYAIAAAGGGGRGGGAPSTGSGQGGAGATGRALYRSDDGGDSWIFGTRQLASAGGKIYADPQHPDVMYLMGT